MLQKMLYWRGMMGYYIISLSFHIIVLRYFWLWPIHIQYISKCLKFHKKERKKTVVITIYRNWCCMPDEECTRIWVAKKYMNTCMHTTEVNTEIPQKEKNSIIQTNYRDWCCISDEECISI